MFAYENLLLHILFGLLLLSVLFCNDDHYGVLSKDFIYGCLVRNREQDPSMGDNFSAYNSRFATTTDVNSSVAISNLRFRFLKRQVSDSSHWPSHIHYLVWILLHAWMFIAILERLPFVWKTRLFRGEFKWNGSSRWKCYRKTVISFEVLPLSRFHRKGLKFFVLFVWLTSARLPLVAKGELFWPRPTRYLVFCKLHNSNPFLFSETFSFRSTICQKPFTEISLQMVSVPGPDFEYAPLSRPWLFHIYLRATVCKYRQVQNSDFTHFWLIYNP